MRSHLEYGVNVWSSGLTKHQSFNIERVQKSSMKVIFGKFFKNYKSALKDLNLDTLETRRRKLNLNFVKKSLKLKNMQNLFPLKTSIHTMQKRNDNKYVINKANTLNIKH